MICTRKRRRPRGADHDGVALQPLFVGDDGAFPERSIFLEADHRNELRAVVRGRHKLIHDRGTGHAALYDLLADPGETLDVGDRSPEVRDRLLAELEAWELGRREGREMGAPDGELMRRLDALGY